MTKKQLEKLSDENLAMMYDGFARQIVDCLENGVLGNAITDRVRIMERIRDVVGMRKARERANEC